MLVDANKRDTKAGIFGHKVVNSIGFAPVGINKIYHKDGEMGFDGIVVSDHAGREVHGAIASLDAFENVVYAVGDKTYIMFDTGIRGATDVFKPLALGAKFVFVGCLRIWGLSIMGAMGVQQVMKSLLAEFDIMMNIAWVSECRSDLSSWLES
jgi:isopentenyl diphosphate isomerase/L-lactate dehydrogenase-like FMN-dependent dehydrogenase